MPAHVLLSLLLAGPPAPAAVETVRTYDLGKMTVAEAKRRDGKPVRVSFTKMAEFDNGDGTVRIAANGQAGIARWVYYPKAEAFNRRTVIVADGELRVYVIPPWFDNVNVARDTHIII